MSYNKPIIIEFCGPPGSGKSTSAIQLCEALEISGLRVHLVKNRMIYNINSVKCAARPIRMMYNCLMLFATTLQRSFYNPTVALMYMSTLGKTLKNVEILITRLHYDIDILSNYYSVQNKINKIVDVVIIDGGAANVAADMITFSNAPLKDVMNITKIPIDWPRIVVFLNAPSHLLERRILSRPGRDNEKNIYVKTGMLEKRIKAHSKVLHHYKEKIQWTGIDGFKPVVYEHFIPNEITSFVQHMLNNRGA